MQGISRSPHRGARALYGVVVLEHHAQARHLLYGALELLGGHQRRDFGRFGRAAAQGAQLRLGALGEHLTAHERGACFARERIEPGLLLGS